MSGSAFHRFANPGRFLRLASTVLPWLAEATAIGFAVGLYFGLLASPPDYQQGETVRITYIHVPAAWIAMFAYGWVGLASAAALIWRHPLADVAAELQTGDVVLGLDHSGRSLVEAEAAGLIADCRRRGVATFFTVHDLLALRLPPVRRAVVRARRSLARPGPSMPQTDDHTTA